MQRAWQVLVFCSLLFAGCASAEKAPHTVIPNQPAAVQTHISPTATFEPAAHSEPTAAAPTFTPTVEPSATPTPVALVHPELTADRLVPGMQTPFSFLAGEEEIRYLVFLPQDFDPAGQWPLILFLHGNNDVGQDISRLADSTLLEFVSDPQDFSFIVISPQLPSGFWPKYIDPIEALLEHLVPLLAIDRSRMYLTGVSAGGYGAWKYILKFPGRFAAAAPIAGPASLSPSSPVPEEVCVLKDLPIRVYHGDADSATPFELNQAMVAALEDCGGNVQFTLIPGGSHADAWITAYSDPGFFDWLLSHQK